MGSGNSVMLVMALSMIADLIGNDKVRQLSYKVSVRFVTTLGLATKSFWRKNLCFIAFATAVLSNLLRVDCFVFISFLFIYLFIFMES